MKSVLTVLLVFPALYVGYTLLPWTNELFVRGNTQYYIPFWSGIIVLHWVTFFRVVQMLKAKGQSLKDIGYRLRRKGTLLLVISYGVLALAVVLFTEWTLQGAGISEEKLRQLPALFPRTSSHRLFFVLAVFTAGFCEEIIYRGYAIMKLRQLGIPGWIALIPAAITFVFIHGINGLNQFWFYFTAGIIFGIIFLLTRRVLPGIILHLLFDLSAIMAVLQAVEK